MDENLQKLKEKYFSDESKVVYLKEGELLLEKGSVNHRLFYLVSGAIKVFNPDAESEYFMFHNSTILGLNSFFSKSCVSRMSLIAAEDTKVLFIERESFYKDEQYLRELAYDFMPVIIELSFNRQEQIYKNGMLQMKAIEHMKDVERMASIGELSAGVAHELNNAITVMDRGGAFISENILKMFKGTKLEMEMMESGLRNGHVITGAEARKQARELAKKSSLNEEVLRDYVRTGFVEKMLNEPADVSARAYAMWSIGTALHDIKLASKQSKHVIDSMRELARQDKVRVMDCDINESIREAFILLEDELKKIDLCAELGKLPQINGNVGEWVQVWSNIIKNAVDAMSSSASCNPKLIVRSQYSDGAIAVSIKDNGPGIPDDIREAIFQPHFTTKRTGKSFGLGLGLAIVQRIVHAYEGTVAVENLSDGAQFNIVIPVKGGKNE